MITGTHGDIRRHGDVMNRWNDLGQFVSSKCRKQARNIAPLRFTVGAVNVAGRSSFVRDRREFFAGKRRAVSGGCP